ncbi:MAG TPA: hypothetical protein DEB63_01295 [Agrobacterium sp.]|uniref:tyrosine-type recombinase/integrase n=1 Tax=Rhizobium sp. TaxID=391 RepID=UPI000E92C7BD|nr:hypothetical protein [Agrobacterium sp.]
MVKFIAVRMRNCRTRRQDKLSLADFRASNEPSLRHTMATELRRRGVSAWEIEGLLGHRRPSTTEKYAHYAPDYLSAGRMAIDAYFETLGLTYTVPRLVHVSEACQSLKTKNPQKGISQ